MFDKFFKFWIKQMMIGSGVVVLANSYLIANRIGIEYIENKRTAKLKYPASDAEMSERYEMYLKSLVERKKVSYEAFVIDYRRRWSEYDSVNGRYLHFLFPFSNPRVKKFEKVVYIGIGSEIVDVGIAALFFFPLILPMVMLKKSKITYSDLPMLVLILDLIGYVASAKNIRDEFVDCIEKKHQFNNWLYFEHNALGLFTYMLLGIFSLSTRTDMKNCSLTKEQLKLAKNLKSYYILLLLPTILYTSFKAMPVVPDLAQSAHKGNSPALANSSPNTDQTSAQSPDKQKIWGLQGLTYLILLKVLNNSKPLEAISPAFKTPNFTTFFFLTSMLSQFASGYSTSFIPLEILLNFAFFSTAIYGFSAIHRLTRLVPK